MRKLTFENFLFQQGHHRDDWLSRVKGKKGVVEASFLACLVLRVIALVFWFSSREHLKLVGQPRGVASLAWRTVRQRLGGRVSMSVSKIQFWSCI
jgi:hypothetical protein